MMKRLHPDFDVYYETLGDNRQTLIVILSKFDYMDDFLKIVSPGRIVLVGDVEEELAKIVDHIGRPTLNEMTRSNDRPSGVFNSSNLLALRQHLGIK